MTKAFSPSQLLAQAASIGNVLKVAGAHDWTPQTIAKYKRQELAKAPGPNFWWKANEKLNGLLPVALSAQAFLAVSPSFLLPQNTSPALVLFLGGWQLASFVFFVWGVFFATARGPAQWNPYRLILPEMGYWSSQTRWIEIIPAEAREIVSRVLLLRPNAKFQVDALEQQTYRLDPILYAVIDGEKNPIIVWGADDQTVKPPVSPED